MLSLFFEPAETWPRRKCLPDWEAPGRHKPSGTLSDLAVTWVDEVEMADVVSRPTYSSALVAFCSISICRRMHSIERSTLSIEVGHR
jgi:hypothetical protein